MHVRLAWRVERIGPPTTKPGARACASGRHSTRRLACAAEPAWPESESAGAGRPTAGARVRRVRRSNGPGAWSARADGGCWRNATSHALTFLHNLLLEATLRTATAIAAIPATAPITTASPSRSAKPTAMTKAEAACWTPPPTIGVMLASPSKNRIKPSVTVIAGWKTQLHRR